MLNIGDRVRKKGGYPWPGVVVAAFRTRAGKKRVVVECTIKEVRGALHIYSPKQLWITRKSRRQHAVNAKALDKNKKPAHKSARRLKR